MRTTPHPGQSVPEFDARRSARPRRVLFLCANNAGCSQLAAALLHYYAAGRVAVRSAGTQPSDEVQPEVVEALLDWGIEVLAEPKSMTDALLAGADLVITLGVVPLPPLTTDARTLQWHVPDCAGTQIEHVRAVRDEIDRRVRALWAELRA